MKRLNTDLALVCLILVASGVSGRAGTSGAEALLARLSQALGGRTTLAKIHTSMTVYECSMSGRTIKLTTTAKTPYFYLQTIEVAGRPGKSSYGFDGKTAWTQDVRGHVKVLTGTDRAELLSDAVSANNSEIFVDRWPTSVASKPSETIDGIAYDVLSITPKGGIESDVFIDARSSMPIAERTTQGSFTVLNLVEAFGRGPLGELQPRITVARRSDGAPEITSVLREAQDNGPVSNAIFAPPVDSKQTQSV